MQNRNVPKASVFVIFGAGGDLAWRKLVPALYDLFLDHWLPERFALIGAGRKKMADEAFREHLREGVDRFSRRGKTDEQTWKEFASRLSYAVADAGDPQTFTDLAAKISAYDKEWHTQANHIFYLALPPDRVEPTVEGLAKARLNRNRERARIVVEKPFGHDLDSARKMNRSLTKIFQEPQIFRIDHYLGKETVQNILAFRFGNTFFEPIWNRRYIDHVQLTVAEEVGVEHRGGYYENAGALRDMIQNHLLQILCLTAMEAPI
jgi:glucose-6-phosphate 1-dehydrogenase